MASGEKTPVGLVWNSRLVSLVFTPDARLFAAFATPESLEATVAATPVTPTPAAPTTTTPKAGSHS
jgi:hypothetical protein